MGSKLKLPANPRASFPPKLVVSKISALFQSLNGLRDWSEPYLRRNVPPSPEPALGCALEKKMVDQVQKLRDVSVEIEQKGHRLLNHSSAKLFTVDDGSVEELMRVCVAQGTKRPGNRV